MDDISMIRMETGDADDVEDVLEMFITKYAECFTFENFEKDNIRTRLWAILFQYLAEQNSPKIYELCLRSVRILSRDKTVIDNTILPEWIDILLYHAALKEDINDINEEQEYTVIIEAMKCLSNLVYNSVKVQLLCSTNGTLDGILLRLRTYPESNLPHLVKYFDMKLLFLISALVPDIRSHLKNELHALIYLMEALDFILKEGGITEENVQLQYSTTLDENAVQLSCEILKVMFNMTVRMEGIRSDDEDECFFRLVAILRELLLSSTPPDMHDTLCSNIINLLTNMPIGCLEMLMPQEGLEYDGEALSVILMFLDTKLSSTPADSLYEVISPSLTLLIEAARNHKVLRRHIRVYVLPPLKDFMQKPEEYDTLRGKLCSLLTSPHTHLRDLVAELLFVLCKENVNRMIKYTGFGNAAGMFAQRGLLTGSRDLANYSSDSEDSETEEYSQFKDRIDPVSGCYMPPRPNPMENMTEEQKEYEAMKLVSMMDKLAREGIVQPCRIGEDGKPQPVDHILQLQEELPTKPFDN